MHILRKMMKCIQKPTSNTPRVQDSILHQHFLFHSLSKNCTHLGFSVACTPHKSNRTVMKEGFSKKQGGGATLTSLLFGRAFFVLVGAPRGRAQSREIISHEA